MTYLIRTVVLLTSTFRQTQMHSKVFFFPWESNVAFSQYLLNRFWSRLLLEVFRETPCFGKKVQITNVCMENHSGIQVFLVISEIHDYDTVITYFIQAWATSTWECFVLRIYLNCMLLPVYWTIRLTVRSFSIEREITWMFYIFLFVLETNGIIVNSTPKY